MAVQLRIVNNVQRKELGSRNGRKCPPMEQTRPAESGPREEVVNMNIKYLSVVSLKHFADFPYYKGLLAEQLGTNQALSVCKQFSA